MNQHASHYAPEIFHDGRRTAPRGPALMFSASVPCNRTLSDKALALSRHIRRPILWPTIGRLLLGKAVQKLWGQIDPDADLRMEDERAAAKQWCEGMAIGFTEALDRLGLDSSGPRFVEQHPHLIEGAGQRLADCPYVDRFDDTEGTQAIAGAAAIDLIYEICRQRGPERILETGVAFGWSSLAILAAIRHRPHARLDSIDMPYLTLDFDAWVGAVVPPELKAKWRLMRMSDRLGLPRALHDLQRVDFCHYDSDKSRKGRIWAYRRIWAAMAPNGLLMSDDISDNLAWKTFCESVGQDSIVLHHFGRYVGLLVKPA